MKNGGNEAAVPVQLRRIVAAIMRRFTINGACDGMYIANRIARVDGTGDGNGTFTTGIVTNQEEVADALMAAYGKNIFEEDLPELCEILRTGTLDPGKALAGIRRYITKCKQEMLTADDVQSYHLEQEIDEARATCEWLMDYEKVRGERMPKVLYRYGMRLRGFAPGCQPMQGLAGAADNEIGSRYHSTLLYTRRLAPKELRAYDLDFIGVQGGAE